MPFTVTARQSASSTTSNVQTLTTASETPTPSSLFLVATGTENAGHTTTQVHSVTGSGLTFTQVAHTGMANYANLTTYGVAASLWSTGVGPSPSASTVTVDPYAGTNTGYVSAVCLDITGHNSSDPVLASATTHVTVNPESNSASGSITLPSTPVPGNLLVVAFVVGADANGAAGVPTAGTAEFTPVTVQSARNCPAGVWYRVVDGTEASTITCPDLGQSVGAYAAVVVEIRAETTASVSRTRTISATPITTGSTSASVSRTRSVSDAPLPPAWVVGALVVQDGLVWNDVPASNLTASAAPARTRSISATLARGDAVEAAPTRTRSVAATGSRSDPTGGSLSRLRSVVATGQRTDSGSAALARTRGIAASAATGATATSTRTRSVAASAVRVQEATAAPARTRSTVSALTRTDPASAAPSRTRSLVIATTSVDPVVGTASRSRGIEAVAQRTDFTSGSVSRARVLTSTLIRSDATDAALARTRGIAPGVSVEHRVAPGIFRSRSVVPTTKLDINALTNVRDPGLVLVSGTSERELVLV